jgi:hypothetical protein
MKFKLEPKFEDKCYQCVTCGKITTSTYGWDDSVLCLDCYLEQVDLAESADDLEEIIIGNSIVDGICGSEWTLEEHDLDGELNDKKI